MANFIIYTYHTDRVKYFKFSVVDFFQSSAPIDLFARQADQMISSSLSGRYRLSFTEIYSRPS